MLHLFYKILAVIILLFLFFVAGGGVSQNDKWRIERIDVAGANTVSAEAVRAFVQQKLSGNYFFVYAKENSFLFPKNEIERALLEVFPRLKTVSVHRVDAHTVVVTVFERKPYALWCGVNADSRGLDAEGRERGTGADMKDCWFIDETGFVFDHAPVFSEGVYVEMYGTLIGKTDGGPLRATLSVARFAFVDTFAKLIRAELGEPVRIEMKGDGEDEIMVRSSAAYPFLTRTTVRFKDGQDSAVLMKNLRAAISAQFPENITPKKKLLYIDMRFGNKIFFGSEE